MATEDIATWQRVEQLALIFGITIVLRGYIQLTDSKGFGLGYFSNACDAYFFLCGYEYYYTYHKSLSAKGV